MEAKAYELEQRTQFVAEAKSVLDSWVRYESQVKQRQQKELAEALINKVKKELENPKVLQQVLQQSVADVERKFYTFIWHPTIQLTGFPRDHLCEDPVNFFCRPVYRVVAYRMGRLGCGSLYSK